MNIRSPNAVNMTTANMETNTIEAAIETGTNSDGFRGVHEGIVNISLPENGFNALNITGTRGRTKGTMVAVQNKVRPSMVASFTSTGQAAHKGTM